MCIIIDANVIHHLKRPTDDGRPVLEWLLRGRGGLVVGGKLKRELIKGSLETTMVVLDQAGRLKKIDDGKVDSLAGNLAASGKCRSNDPHLIAVAILSGCRLLYSADRDLHYDVKNPEILKPAASIYQSKEKHEHLLTECHCD